MTYYFSRPYNSHPSPLHPTPIEAHKNTHKMAKISPQVIKTELTDLLKITHPVILAGMSGVSGARLAAAVSNAGGLGTIGGVRMNAQQLRREIADVKAQLDDPTCYGIDLLLPQVGGSARKTNYDYTKGELPEIIDIIIEGKARVFISAVGVPPRWVVEKLHKAGILCMNMIGHPKHVKKAIAVGMDILCCQGYDAGGHTGEIGTAVLVPMCLDAAKGHVSELTGGPVQVVGSGGIYDGRSTAAMLAMGAQAVWVGTRFIACEEATATKYHKKLLVEAGPTDTLRTVIYTGRPVRTLITDYVRDWEENRQSEIKELVGKGVVPYVHASKKAIAEGKKLSYAKTFMYPAGQVSGSISEILTAKQIVDSMTYDAAALLQSSGNLVTGHKARL